MDLIKTGVFISAMRKQNGLTQAELAEKIGVTYKAVSRWETGRGFPDVSILLALSEALNVSVLELLIGEANARKDDNEMQKEGKAVEDKAIVDVLIYTKQMAKKAIWIMLILISIGMVISPLFVSAQGIWLSVVGVVLLAVSIISVSSNVMTSFKETAKKIFSFPKQQGTYIISTLAMIIAIISEAHPHSVAIQFASGPDTRYIEKFSYFSLTLFGNGNVFPMLTAVLCIVIALNANSRHFLCGVL
ncbi:MAG: helix-turn-helix domain-containing protein [Lachnospiraceae bacterium]|jgi:transcriptional regulator with XRE-family HTH domain|nr:helix-turn-helix domain-containing protein [Lachnospiraceae bacterium]